MPPRYYVPELVRPLTRLKYRLLDGRRPFPQGPKHVQIQTVSGCNGNCIFCPNQKTAIDIPMGHLMDMDLFKRIIDQVVEIPCLKRISPYLMNEPMLDRLLPERVKHISDRRPPGVRIKINSHGNACTETMAKRLLDAGLTHCNFSVQGIDPEAYRQTMGLNFERTVENIERMVRLRDEGNYRTKINVVMLDTTMTHPHLDAIRAFWRERGITIHINQLENRGNSKGIQSDEIAVHALQTYHWCNRLFDQIYILFDGRLVMCCADWEQTGVLGDANRESIAAIWHGERYRDFRRRFLTGEVQGMLCDGCTKDGGDDED
ncbi:radical SAM protein [Candidatus Sumerlaeota bacterium]|nr:radical SAM protein [Candidatus Sumerlaeota bacterium]